MPLKMKFYSKYTFFILTTTLALKLNYKSKFYYLKKLDDKDINFTKEMLT